MTSRCRFSWMPPPGWATTRRWKAWSWPANRSRSIRRAPCWCRTAGRPAVFRMFRSVSVISGTRGRPLGAGRQDCDGRRHRARYGGSAFHAVWLDLSRGGSTRQRGRRHSGQQFPLGAGLHRCGGNDHRHRFRPARRLAAADAVTGGFHAGHRLCSALPRWRSTSTCGKWNCTYCRWP